jgi:hypothetical protein
MTTIFGLDEKLGIDVPIEMRDHCARHEAEQLDESPETRTFSRACASATIDSVEPADSVGAELATAWRHWSARPVREHR